MEIIFNCKECDQELSVDAEAAGSEFNCPTCGTQLTVPQADGATASTEADGAEAAPPPRTFGTSVVNAMKMSAGAKEEHHFKVTLREHASESLIQKPNLPLEVAAKEAYKIKVKTIRHSDCVEVGHDKFDEIVTRFLNQIGEGKLMSLNPITYQYIEIGSQKVVTDFGVLIIYHTT